MSDSKSRVYDDTQIDRHREDLPYLPNDALIQVLHNNCQKKLAAFNAIPLGYWQEKASLFRDIIGFCGDSVRVEGPFYCDYGYHISVGDNFFANYNLTILDVGHVRIGDDVLIGPNVAIYAVGHAIDPDLRKEGWEFCVDVEIGDNVWIGGSCVINPGVSIRSNSVIGAGSVVTRDIPANVVAAGNPARVLREIGPRDREYYWREKKYDFPMPGQKNNG